MEYAYGICLYVGQDTKIFKNSQKAPRKVSALMKVMNKMLLSVFLFQMVIVMLYASLSMFWIVENRDNKPYLNIDGKSMGVARWIS